LITFTGTKSNCYINMSILIGSRNLYPALNDTVVGTCIDPNKFSEVSSKHNLEESTIYCALFTAGFLLSILNFSTCINSLFLTFFRRDHVRTDQETSKQGVL